MMANKWRLSLLIPPEAAPISLECRWRKSFSKKIVCSLLYGLIRCKMRVLSLISGEGRKSSPQSSQSSQPPTTATTTATKVQSSNSPYISKYKEQSFRCPANRISLPSLRSARFPGSLQVELPLPQSKCFITLELFI